ncbi:LacI family DNA-binding transcriptional regulator [Enterococcus massiliensis]|uniref:LacI family DNA-binding transcriptional regulator n=1 Tax=Enterococcus massiliensis TaxID=1640685 RepID=UPI00065DD11F|nr:LacI family DNA-binding transcriptional regulator [Enterococcus massiliensis]
MATIRDVAKLADLSVATVSRAINGSGYVSENSQKKIDSAIKALNFRPNEVARSLYQKKSKLVGLLLPDISNPFFPLLAKGVEDFLHGKGYQVILGNVQENSERAVDYIHAFSQNNIAGVLSAVDSDNITYDDVKPLVFLDRVGMDSEYSIHADDIFGGALAAQTVLATSPKGVIVIAGPKEVDRSHDRLQGMIKILNQSKIRYYVVHSTSFLLEDAIKTAQEVFEHFPLIDTAIAPSDIHAIALIQEGYRRGIKVPDDLQVIGYDDIPISNLVVPPLTTIHQPAYEIGYKGAEMLYQLMNNQKVNEKKIILPVKLIERDTLRKKENK